MGSIRVVYNSLDPLDSLFGLRIYMFLFKVTSQVISWISEPGVLNHY